MISEFFQWLHHTSGLLIEWDRILFHKVNQEWTSPFFDKLMTYVTSPEETRWLLLFLILLLIYKLRRRAVVVILGCALSLLVADVTAARVIKPIVGRQRPEFSRALPKLLVPSQSSWSFPSNHAANTFAVATFLGLTIAGVGPFALFLAGLVSYSRVYVGVHYPIDVIGGGILGFMSGLLVYYFFSAVQSFLFPKGLEQLPKKWKKKDYSVRTKV